MSKATDKKEHILDCGMEVMFRQGYNGTGVQDIVSAAGVPKGSFYNYFDSKESFAVEGVTRASQSGFESARQVLTAEGVPPLQRVINYFEQGVQCQVDAGFVGGCLVGNLCQEMADASEMLRNRVNSLMCGHVELIRECFREAIEMGDLPQRKNPDDMAEFVFCAWEGALMRMKAAKSRESLDSFMRVLKSAFLA